MRQHLTKPGYKKKLDHAEVRTISVTIHKLCTKNYLKFSYTLNSPTLQSRKSSNALAIAMNYFNRCLFKKIVKWCFYSFFVTVTEPVSVSIVHSNFSPLDTSRKSLTKAGMVVVNEPATDCIFVSYFIFMPLIYLIHYINTYIYLFTNIYNYLNYLLYRNLYILKS